VTIVSLTAAIEPAVLADRELGLFALWGLSFGSWQRRPDQRSMDRPLVFRSVAVVVVGSGRRIWRVCGFREIRRAGEFFRRGVERFVEGRRVGRDGRGWRKSGAIDDRSGDQRSAGLLLSESRRLRLLVLVIRIAGGAARLLHLVLDHGDHRMIGDPALARTVVVKNVTEPNPALLHELPRSFVSLVGFNIEE